MQNPLHAYSQKAPCAAHGKSAASDVRGHDVAAESPSAETDPQTATSCG